MVKVAMKKKKSGLKRRVNGSVVIHCVFMQTHKRVERPQGREGE